MPSIVCRWLIALVGFALVAEARSSAHADTICRRECDSFHDCQVRCFDESTNEAAGPMRGTLQLWLMIEGGRPQIARLDSQDITARDLAIGIDIVRGGEPTSTFAEQGLFFEYPLVYHRVTLDGVPADRDYASSITIGIGLRYQKPRPLRAGSISLRPTLAVNAGFGLAIWGPAVPESDSGGVFGELETSAGLVLTRGRGASGFVLEAVYRPFEPDLGQVELEHLVSVRLAVQFGDQTDFF